MKVQDLLESVKFTDVTKKYQLKKLPAYHDAPDVKRFAMLDDKKSTIFELEVDGSNYKVYSDRWDEPAKTFTDLDKLMKYVDSKGLGSAAKKLSDEEVMKFFSNMTGENLKVSDLKDLAYINWGKSIQLVERHSDVGFELPYIQFIDGDRNSDDYVGLAKISMTVKDLKAWLDAHSVKEKPKPQRRSSGSYYD